MSVGLNTRISEGWRPLLDAIRGVYLKDYDVSRLDDQPKQFMTDSILMEVASRAIDPKAAERLWI